MGKSDEKSTKSFSLKKSNIVKLEKQAFKEKRKQSIILDEILEEYYGSK